MCGLFASIGFLPDPARVDIVAHRGPDGRGWQVFDSPAGPVALGHRRLAIIDVSDAALQPMSDPSGRFQIVFNGEIYNFIELRDELMKRGEVFITRSDTEVLLRAWLVWGDAVLPKLRGMFAFVIWDRLEKRLVAVRDRFGIKPLYCVQIGGRVAFGSEIKQLLRLDGRPARMNLGRVHDFLAFGISDHSAETMFHGITQVRGGEICVVNASGAACVSHTTRWHVIASAHVELDERQAAERFHDHFEQSIALHLRSDVAIGSCLSGGLDSSSIVCVMAGMLESRRVNTFSACYEEKSVDEKPFMDCVVTHAGTVPHFVFPKPEDVFAHAEVLTWYQDEPFGSTSVFAQWCVFEEARRAGVKVMLDGQGADEQLAGYHFAFAIQLGHLLRNGRIKEAVAQIRKRRQLHGAPLISQVLRALPGFLPSGLAEHARGRHRRLLQHDWLDGPLLRASTGGKGTARAAGKDLGLPDVTDLDSLCVNQTYASNLPMLLHWEDRSSMAHSVEARVPFLDNPLVDFSLALGNKHKIVGATTKQVLRHSMSGVLPDMVRDRQDKLGFATPEETWFRGPLRPQVEAGIEQTLALYPGLLNGPGLRRLTKDMLDGRKPFDFLLWRVVNLGIWGRRFGVSA